jgi:hypothetical protein
VAVVEHVGALLRELELSPLTKPEYDAVMAGGVAP